MDTAVELRSLRGWCLGFRTDSEEMDVRPLPPPCPPLFCPRKGDCVDVWDGSAQCWVEVVVEKWNTNMRAWNVSSMEPAIHASAMRPGLIWVKDAWVERKMSAWVLQPPPTFIAEPARSGRSVCHECNTLIDVRALRLGVQQIRISKGFFAKKLYWFHVDCFEPRRTHGLCAATFEGSADLCESDLVVLNHIVNGTSVATPRVGGADVTIACADPFVIARACRIAISTDVRIFRDSCLSGAGVVCPFTQTPLDVTNAHVHHEKPFAFHDMVTMFIAQVGTQQLIRFGEFAEPSIARKFQELHQRMARMVLVHADANLSLLKRDPTLGTCSHCGKAEQLRLFPLFMKALCNECCYERSGFLLSKTSARMLFHLKDEDLAGLAFHEFANPVSRNFADMKLYRRLDVRRVAEKKHGDSIKIVQMHVDKAARQRALHAMRVATPSRLLRSVPTHEERQHLQHIRQRSFGKTPGKTLDAIKKRLEKSVWE